MPDILAAYTTTQPLGTVPANALDLSEAKTPAESSRPGGAPKPDPLLERYLRDVSTPTQSQGADDTWLRNIHRMAIEPGMPRPGETLAFAAAAAAFVKAAAENNIIAMAAAERRMYSTFDIPWDRYHQALSSALIVAARHDALAATTYLVKRESHPLEPKRWQVTYEAAFITACRHGAYDVMGFYLSDALGDAYPHAVKMRPEVMAWGIYRSSAGDASTELLQRVRARNTSVAQIYEAQMALLVNAQEGRVDGVQDSIGTIGKDCPFVFREAAEKAIERGHLDTVKVLVPNIPLYWLPELIRVSGSCNRLDIADEIMSQVATRLRTVSPIGGPFRFVSSSGSDPSEPYGERKLVAEAIRGAAAAGHLDLVKKLATRVNETDWCKDAAVAALENSQKDVLVWAISGLATEERKYRLNDDKHELQALMTLALKQGDAAMRDCLLREKGVLLCVDRDHIKDVAIRNDQGAFNAIIQGASRADIASALRSLCWYFRPNEDIELRAASHYILTLVDRCAPTSSNPLLAAPATVIDNSREEALHDLAWGDQHETIRAILGTAHVTAKMKDRAFSGAITGASEACFVLLLPHASAAEIQDAFKAASGIHPNWSPNGKSKLFLTRLIAAGARDPEKLYSAARHLANRESSDDKNDTSPSESVAIIENPVFPNDRAAELLIEVGLNVRPRVVNALAAKPNVNIAIVNLYAAARARDMKGLEVAARLIQPGEELALQNAAQQCISQKFGAGAQTILNSLGTHPIDLQVLVYSSQYASDLETLQFLIDRGAVISDRMIDYAVREKRKDMLAIILKGKEARTAVQIYVASIDANKHLSATWAQERADIFETLGAMV